VQNVTANEHPIRKPFPFLRLPPMLGHARPEHHEQKHAVVDALLLAAGAAMPAGLDLGAEAGPTLGGAALTFSYAARSGREVNDGNTGGTRKECRHSLAHHVQRTNDLVKAGFRLVELRGLEPLTFSLIRNW